MSIIVGLSLLLNLALYLATGKAIQKNAVVVEWPNPERLRLLHDPSGVDNRLHALWNLDGDDRPLRMAMTVDYIGAQKSVTEDRTNAYVCSAKLLFNELHKVTVKIWTDFNDYGTTVVQYIQTLDKKDYLSNQNVKGETIALDADKISDKPFILVFRQNKTCDLVVYNSNVQSSNQYTVEATDACKGDKSVRVEYVPLIAERKDDKVAIKYTPTNYMLKFRWSAVEVHTMNDIKVEAYPIQQLIARLSIATPTTAHIEFEIVPPATHAAILDKFTLTVTEIYPEKRAHETLVILKKEPMTELKNPGTHFIKLKDIVNAQMNKTNQLVFQSSVEYSLGSVYAVIVTTNDNKESAVQREIHMPRYEPRKPIDINIEVENAAMYIKWKNPRFFGPPVNGYEIIAAPADAQLNLPTISVKLNRVSNSKRIFDLMPFTYYFIMLISIFEKESVSINLGAYKTCPGKSSPPQNVLLHALDNGSLILSWDKPLQFQGHLDAYKYICESKFESLYDAGSSVEAPQTQVLVTEFPRGVEVICFVSAHTTMQKNKQCNMLSVRAKSNVCKIPLIEVQGSTPKYTISNVTAPPSHQISMNIVFTVLSFALVALLIAIIIIFIIWRRYSKQTEFLESFIPETPSDCKSAYIQT